MLGLALLALAKLWSFFSSFDYPWVGSLPILLENIAVIEVILIDPGILRGGVSLPLDIEFVLFVVRCPLMIEYFLHDVVFTLIILLFLESCCPPSWSQRVQRWDLTKGV